jgi:hypothetical protein
VSTVRTDGSAALSARRPCCWATPTICGDRIFMRVVTTTGDARQEKLVCIGTP